MATMPRLAIVAWAILSTSAWATEFPYTAYVASDKVEVRSGPGENYYPVLKLHRGEPVEVYRRDPGGWFAIRPPDEAFSWVSAEFIELGEDEVGVVTGDRVAARVGSTFGDTRDVIQVRMDRGEEVQVLDAREFDSGSGPQTWYKIAPPAGEFRWISGRFVERERSAPARRRPKKHTRRRREDPGDLDQDENTEDEIRPAAHHERASDTAARKRTHRAPDDDTTEDDDASDDNLLPGPARSRLAHRQPKADLREEAADLDVALSEIVAEETSEWDFTLLRRQADAARARAETARERGHVRRVLRKIDNFADIQRRYVAVMRHTEMSDRSDRRSGRPGSSDSSPFSSSADRDLAARFDGQGRLTQITTADPRAPQFALVDASGQVASYVSPAPGVNLRRFLNQEVGIHGTRGYLADRQARHLTARRIETLGDNRLR